MTLRNLKGLALGALLSVSALSMSRQAWAGPATDTVKAKQTELYALVSQTSPDADQKVRALFDDMIDYEAIASSALGDQWGKLSDGQRKEFVDVLKQLVRGAYKKNLKKTLAYDISYLSEESAGGQILVKTSAKHKTDARAEPIAITFKLADKAGKLRVVDIDTEGVSLVGSYRSQFAKIIAKDGYPVLIQKMKDKVAKGEV